MGSEAKISCFSLSVFAAWLGAVLSLLLPLSSGPDSALGYYLPTLCGCAAVGGFVVVRPSTPVVNRSLLYLSLVVCLLFSILTTQPSVFKNLSLPLWLVTFLASGVVIGSLIRGQYRRLVCLYPGFAAAAILAMVPVFSISVDGFGTAVTVVLPLLIVMLMILAFGSLRKPVEAAEVEHKQVSDAEPFGWLRDGLFALFIVIEAMIVFWSVVCMDDHQGLISRSTFPLFLLALVLIRNFGDNLVSRLSSPGWHFALSAGVMFSLGYFYTFSITPLFIFTGGMALGLLLPVHRRLYGVAPDSRQVLYLLLILFLGLLTSGAYLYNHVQFITSIGMPGEVVALSARQAIIKEMAVFSGIGMIGSGFLFLKRKKTGRE